MNAGQDGTLMEVGRETGPSSFSGANQIVATRIMDSHGQATEGYSLLVAFLGGWLGRAVS